MGESRNRSDSVVPKRGNKTCGRTQVRGRVKIGVRIRVRATLRKGYQGPQSPWDEEAGDSGGQMHPDVTNLNQDMPGEKQIFCWR